MINKKIDSPHIKSKAGFLTDGEGIPSSKRLFGAVLLCIGITLGLALFSFDMLNKDTSFEYSYKIFFAFLTMGTVSLGLGTVDNIKKILKK